MLHNSCKCAVCASLGFCKFPYFPPPPPAVILVSRCKELRTATVKISMIINLSSGSSGGSSGSVVTIIIIFIIITISGIKHSRQSWCFDSGHCCADASSELRQGPQQTSSEAVP